MIESENWKVEALFGSQDHTLEYTQLTEKGLAPTYLNIDGEFMISANSPGLSMRNM